MNAQLSSRKISQNFVPGLPQTSLCVREVKAEASLCEHSRIPKVHKMDKFARNRIGEQGRRLARQSSEIFWVKCQKAKFWTRP